MRNLVSELRTRSEGRPVGIKIAAGRIERDLEFCVYARPDFITIDGRGGATGALPAIIRDSTSVPTIYALYRARKYLDSVGSDIDLVITGGLRVSSDFAKAIAMGAEAMFLDKYGDIVTVYKIGDVSIELCGGPHVERTGELGNFKIKKEEASSSGVRRIKAILQ